MIRQSDTVTALAKALVSAQSHMTNAPKETKGQVGSQVRYYTDLPTLTDLVRPILAAHGLAYIQLPSGGGNGTVSLTTRLFHTSGEWIEDDYSMPSGQNGAQGVGSALTYARRYALMALLGVAADDDDGAAASQASKPARKPTATPPAESNAAPDSGPTFNSPGGALHARLKGEVAADKKTRLKEMAGFMDRKLTAADFDNDPDWRTAVEAILDD